MEPSNLRLVAPTRAGQTGRILHELIDVNRFAGFFSLLKPEALNPLDRLRAVERGLLDDVNLTKDPFFFAVALDKLRVAEYRGQYVIEVVRNAGSELSKRAQLVCLSSTLACQSLFGDVARD